MWWERKCQRTDLLILPFGSPVLPLVYIITAMSLGWGGTNSTRLLPSIFSQLIQGHHGQILLFRCLNQFFRWLNERNDRFQRWCLVFPFDQISHTLQIIGEILVRHRHVEGWTSHHRDRENRRCRSAPSSMATSRRGTGHSSRRANCRSRWTSGWTVEDPFE